MYEIRDNRTGAKPYHLATGHDYLRNVPTSHVHTLDGGLYILPSYLYDGDTYCTLRYVNMYIPTVTYLQPGSVDDCIFRQHGLKYDMAKLGAVRVAAHHPIYQHHTLPDLPHRLRLTGRIDFKKTLPDLLLVDLQHLEECSTQQPGVPNRNLYFAQLSSTFDIRLEAKFNLSRLTRHPEDLKS